MPLKVCSLYSGSSGNAIFLEYNGTTVLIDCGISCKRICDLLLEIGKNPENISAILVTHEHSDHIKGIQQFAKTYNTRIYAHTSLNEFLYLQENITSLCFPQKIHLTTCRKQTAYQKIYSILLHPAMNFL